MKLVCLGVGRLLDRRSSGLSAAEGLRIEEHLSTCADCRADANLLEALSVLASTAPVGLSVSARERAIANALSVKARPQAPRAVPARRIGMLLLGAAAAMALGFVAVQRASRVEVAASSERVLSGSVEVAGSGRSAGAALGSDVQLHASEAAVVALAHARVELRAGSDARWDGAARKVELQRGSALFEVDPAPHQSFTVQTKAFTVRVLGTRFEVTQSAVVVLSGRVSVQPSAAVPNHAPVVLTAGSAQTRFEASSAATEQAHADLQPKAANSQTANAERGTQPNTADGTARVGLQAADGERTRFGTQPSAVRTSTDAQDAVGERARFDAQARADRRRGSEQRAAGTEPQRVGAHAPGTDHALPGHEPAGAARGKRSERLDAGALLERARSELAARDLPQARATLDLAKPHLRDAPLRAQALSLEAECALQAHRYSAARDTYLRVARKFPGMPAAETALFAAARIEAEHGDPKHAAELFRNYLSKHRQGSYVREAERRLQLLPKQATP